MTWLAIERKSIRALLAAAALCVAVGCGTTEKKEQDSEFFTSGSREADQRASQRMAKAEQLSGSGEGTGENENKKKDGEKHAEERLALYERLGGEPGLSRIVDDFIARAVADPRVNWERAGVERGGFSFGRNKSVTWNASSNNLARLKKHMVQFFAVATGGPPRYEGKDMRAAHSELRISNAEFDAAVGDLKASLDKLKIPNQEQKELLAIVESTRPQVVMER